MFSLTPLSFFLIMGIPSATAQLNAPTVINHMTGGPITKPTDIFLSLDKATNQIHQSPQPIKGNTPLARVNYKPSLTKTGWDFVHASTEECEENTKALDPIKSFSSGYGEGYATMQSIHNFGHNTEIESGVTEDPAITKEALTVLNQQDQFVGLHDCAQGEDSEKCKYNRQAYLIHMQMHGMLQGYNAAVAQYYPDGPNDENDTLTPKPLTMFDLLRLNCDGAIRDYLEAFHQTSNAGSASSSASSSSASSMIEEGSEEYEGSEEQDQSKIPNYRLGVDGQKLPGRCSAMVKLTKDAGGNPKDILLGHTTWEDFTESTRTWKVGDFCLKNLVLLE